MASLVGKSAYEHFPDIYYKGSEFEKLFIDAKATKKPQRRVCGTDKFKWDMDVRPIIVDGEVVQFVSFVNMIGDVDES